MSDINLPARITIGEDAEPWMDELDEAILAGGDIPEEARRWKITGVETAEWAMAKLAKLREREAEVERQYKVWQARIDGWRYDELARISRPASFFEAHLMQWGIESRRADPKLATLHLPSGEVRTTAHKETGPKLVVEDAEKLAGWLLDNTDAGMFEQLVRTEHHPKISEIRKHVTADEVVTRSFATGEPIESEWRACWVETGEVIPGLTVEDPKAAWIDAKAVPEL